ncbi:universal stress protein [Actinomadura formosensis]|uniref:universal stress protein n=1 Tax=Actinomadura formosensis TaxID=60706 RepID=UPI003D916C28
MNAPVIAGVDGSSASPRCVAWAAAEAHLRHCPLELVHASTLLHRDGSLSDDAYEQMETDRTRMLDDAEAYARMLRPDVEVRARLLDEEAGRTLLAESGNAELVVVGTRRVAGADGRLFGSVGREVAARARCPVLAIPASAPEPAAMPAEVAVGVQERHGESRTIGWAFEEASLRGAHLTAIHAFGAEFGAARQKVGQDTLLSEALAGWSPRYPDVQVTRTVSDQHPAQALVAASDGAAMVVVGATRRGGGNGPALGKVDQALLDHALAPVAVVPEI